MPSKSRAAAAGSGFYAAGKAARDNTYVQRLIEDEELRESLRDAFVAARNAYDRVSHGKRPARTLMDDKKVHRDLQNAATSLREAADALRHGRKRRGGWFKRIFVIGLVGAGIAVVASEGVRKKILDALFGAEEEFEYTSTTTPAPAATAATNGAGEPAAAKAESGSAAEGAEEKAEKS
jgi:hypothetical protein